MANYDKIAELYYKRRKDKSRFDYNRDIEVPAMVKMLGDVQGKAILDLACGFGDHLKKLSKKGARICIGIDASSKLLKFAKNLQIPGTEFYQGDINKKLKFNDNAFDIIFCSLALHYLDNLNKLFVEVRRVLKRNGIFAFSTGHPIFDLINQSPRHMIGVKKVGKKRIISGDYFDESAKMTELGGLGNMMCCNYTYETFIKTGLKNGFELVDYVDAKPVPSSKRRDPEKYRLTTTLPTFVLFKFKKK